MHGIEEIKKKLESFKKKFYVRQVLVGTFIFLILSISLFLFLNSIEYQFWLGKAARTVIFFSFLTCTFIFLFNLVLKPLLKFFKLIKGISDEEAASHIADSFPELEDKLLNTLQLSKLTNYENELLIAAIDKKTLDFRGITFIKAVDFSSAKKYGYILGFIVTCFVLVSFINPSIIKDSSNRFVKFNQDFLQTAPFQFNIVNNSLEGFKGEDFTLQIEITGDKIPSDAYIITDESSRFRLSKKESLIYSYTYQKIQSSKSFYIEAAGFYSKKYQIQVNERPDLIVMSIQIVNPTYTGGEVRQVTNTGDLTILEGSTIKWSLSTLATESATFHFNLDTSEIKKISTSDFELERRVLISGTYEIALFNSFGKNASRLEYNIDVIEDEYPKIKVEYFPDSSLYQFITLAGSIVDDYGFTSLRLNYKKDKDKHFKSIPLEINKQSRSQSFYANWNIDSLSVKPGNSLEFYLEVADNDGVNGAKTTKSQIFILQIPTEDEIDSNLDKKSKKVENQIDKSKTKAEDINERLRNLENKLKADQKYDWQEKKQVDNIINDREKLSEEIKKLQKQHDELQKSNEQFKSSSEEQKNKNELLQKLLDELMDEETKKLYDQLKELMKENAPSEQVTQQLEKLRQNEKNLEKELERALELFKRLKMESALEKNLQKLDTLSQQQEKVANDNDSNLEKGNIREEQKDVQDQFNKFREQMDKIQELNQELKRPEPMEDFELEERQIAKELNEIQEELENGDSAEKEESDKSKEDQLGANPDSKQNSEGSRTKQKQKNAAEKMKNLSQKLSKMQSGMQMEMMQANLDQLRDILDNLLKLSFNQEELLSEMKTVNQSDPRFLELSQGQLKLKDDSKVIQDSLLSLAEKVVQISSFITREIGLINENIDQSLTYLKDRNRGRALSAQQFAMTSINNLALLLDDTMQQMQMSMSESMGNQSKGDKKQQGLPDLQEMQNELGQKMEELKGSGKTGRQLSEELARMAAEQEMIRRQMEILKEMQEGKPGGGLGGDELKKAIDMMEQNEIDLVNKQLTQRLINRQKSIETRMLEAEKAQRQQEMEEERESQSPTIISRDIPLGFEEYLKLKQKEIELLKTIPLELNPFYKKEVNDYFRRLSSDDKND